MSSNNGLQQTKYVPDFARADAGEPLIPWTLFLLPLQRADPSKCFHPSTVKYRYGTRVINLRILFRWNKQKPLNPSVVFLEVYSESSVLEHNAGPIFNGRLQYPFSIYYIFADAEYIKLPYYPTSSICNCRVNLCAPMSLLRCNRKRGRWRWTSHRQGRGSWVIKNSTIGCFSCSPPPIDWYQPNTARIGWT